MRRAQRFKLIKILVFTWATDAVRHAASAGSSGSRYAEPTGGGLRGIKQLQQYWWRRILTSTVFILKQWRVVDKDECRVASKTYECGMDKAPAITQAMVNSGKGNNTQVDVCIATPKNTTIYIYNNFQKSH
jgi:hypothetical protein